MKRDPDDTQPIPDSLPLDVESLCPRCYGSRSACICTIADALTEKLDAIAPDEAAAS